MPLLPQLKALFDAQHSAPPPPAYLEPAQLREQLHAMIEESFLALTLASPPSQIERDARVPVENGEITVRLYRDGSGATLPCHVYFHGGGFFLGTLGHGDANCRRLAADAGCAVVSVDYRLAPEHPFPTAVEDAFAALLWVVENAGTLGIDPARISVGGGSAGGNLAAVVALLARDRAGPALAAQILEIPVTDFTSERTLDFPEENIRLGSEKGYASLYLADPSEALDPRASPLLAQSLADLPPALVLCAQYDQLQPEGEAYAARLVDAGVRCVYRCLIGQFHGSQGFDRLIPELAAAYRADIAAFLKEAYGERP